MAYDAFVGSDEYHVYHERQLNDSNLCAVHCVNNLLQYPYFDVQTCEHYVEQLKQKEREMLMTDADPTMVINDSMLTEYVSGDGNYSIEVIKYALATEMFNLSMHRWGTRPDELEHPHELTGFICHFKNHWIALRKIYGQWYDLNSLSGLPETLAVPCTVSDFYLSARLGTLKEQGYSIFAVTGEYPPLHQYSELSELEHTTKWNGRLVNTVKVYKATELKSRVDTYPKNLLNDVNRSNIGQSVGIGAHGGSDEYMLQAAMQASMEDATGGGGGGAFGDFGMGGMGSMNGMGGMNSMGGMGMNADEQLQQAIAASMMQSHSNNNNTSNNNNNNGNNNDKTKNSGNNDNNNNGNDNNNNVMNEEDEMAQGIFMSMQGDYAMKVPPEPEESNPNRIEMNLKLINGNQVKRGFLKDNILDDVANYVKSIETIDILNDNLQFKLPPRDTFSDMNMKLSELGGKRLRLIVQKNENKDQDMNGNNNNNNNDKNKNTDDAKEDNDTQMNGQ